MSIADSDAVFKARATEVGLKAECLEKLVAAGLNTMSSLAFSRNYAPGNANDGPFLDLLTNVLGEVDVGQKSCMRRLFAESYSAVAADIRTQVDAGEDSAPRKLAPANRAQRLREQQARLTGLSLRGHLEPGDTLIDTLL